MSSDGARNMYRMLRGEGPALLQRMLHGLGIEMTSDDERVLLRAILAHIYPQCPGVIDKLFHVRSGCKRKAGEVGDEAAAVAVASGTTAVAVAAADGDAAIDAAVGEIATYQEMSSWVATRQATSAAWRLEANVARHATLAAAVSAVGAEQESTAEALRAIDKATAAYPGMNIDPGRAEELEREVDDQYDALIDLQALAHLMY